MKKKIMGLCIMLAFVLQAVAPILAVDNAENQNMDGTPTEIIVNGEDILTTDNYTVQCGAGTAKYNKDKNTLTLKNAVITEPYTLVEEEVNVNVGIYANGNLKVVLEGTNIIELNDVQTIFEGGIAVFGNFDISGTGSLEINANGGISSQGALSITDSTIELNLFKLDASNMEGSSIAAPKMTIDHASVTFVGGALGFNIGELKIINGSSVDVKTSLTLYGIGAIHAEKMIISDSKVIAEGNALGILSVGDLSITNSHIKASATSENKGTGIVSSSQITINGGSVEARGSLAAILVFSTEPETKKIEMTGVIDRNAKISVSDLSSNFYAYVTSYISLEDDKLNDNLDNALKEVNLVPASTVTFDVSEGNEVDFTVEIPTGEMVSEPTMIPTKEGHHFSGWYLEDTKFDFATTAIGSDITLKAKLEAHVPGAEATIDHAQTCSVCGEVLKPKLPSKEVVVNESTGIEAKYEDGKSFDKNMTLSVTPITIKNIAEINKDIDKIAKGFTIAGLYDIKLLKDGAEVQPNGKMKISIPLTEAMKKMRDLQIIYIDDNGKISIVPSEVKDGKITFVTDHFSQYGVIGKTATPDTGDTTQLGLMYALLIISGVVLIKKVKKI